MTRRLPVRAGAPADKTLRLLLVGLLAALTFWYVWIAIASSARPVEASLPPLPPPRAGDTILVFAPHEDDETLGAAGYLRRAVVAGASVYVCLMTAGEGEELGAALLNKRPRVSPQGYVRLGQVRQRESEAALAMIGLPSSHIIFLNYPCMGLRPLWSADNWSGSSPWTSPYTRTAHSPFDNSLTPAAAFCGSSVLSDVQQVLQRVRPTVILLDHPADIHPDHWATYGFTKLALEELRRRERPAWLRGGHLYTYLVHRRGWPVPWGYYPDLKQMPPAALLPLAMNHWLTFPLSTDDVRVKNRMILTYRSQMARFDLLLRAFARRTEVVAEISDISLVGGEPLGRSLFAEPVADSAYIRDRPYADLEEVALRSDPQGLQIRVRTRASMTPRVRLTVLMHIVDPRPGEPEVLQIDSQQNAPTVVTAARNGFAPAPVPGLAQCALSGGEFAIVNLPQSLLGRGEVVIVDVLTQVGRRVVDHSMTRTVLLPRE